MSISPKLFRRHKCDTESLKALATAKKESDGWKKLRKLINERIKDGRERSLKDYRIWAAVDLAYDAPFHQETPTLIRHILSTCDTAEKVKSAVSSWGLCEGSLFCTEKGEKPGDPDKMWLNPQIFHEVLVPAVRGYLSVRLSKIFNDRNLDPLFKYVPQRLTELNRVRCEIVTDIVQTMATQFGYADNLKQMILNTLLYSVCLEFPVEAWTCDKQESEEAEEVGEGKKKEKRYKEYVVREGVRFVAPHITRIFYDMQYPLSTFNTDTGNTFAGYWSVMRAGDVLDNKMYWNTESVGYGHTDWLDKTGPYRNYFEQAYPCTLTLPVVARVTDETSREKINNIYTASDYDKALFVTHLFMKIVPKDYGIGTYTHPVWFRFIIGSEDTVIFAEPMAYRPITYSGYDPDSNRAKNASLALEIMPWQDMLGNTLTQILLTIKRNLANIQFYDADMVDGAQVGLLQKRSQWQYQHINLIPYSGAKAFRAGTQPGNTFHEIKFAYADVSAMFTSLQTQLAMLERMLGISSQEIGAAASHQQGNKEIELINSGSTNRVSYTASSIDNAIDAKKVQLYEALMAHKDSDVSGQVSNDIPNVAERVEELGFKYDEKKDKAGRKMVVRGKKKALTLESFASSKDGPARGTDKETARAISLAIQGVSSNGVVGPVVDPQSMMDALMNMAKLAGAPDDFNIKINKEAGVAAQLGQAMEQIKQMIEAQIAQSMKPAAEAVAEQEQKINATEQNVAQLTQLVAQIDGTLKQLETVVQSANAAPPLAPPQPEMVPPQVPIVPPLADASQTNPIISTPAGQAPILA